MGKIEVIDTNTDTISDYPICFYKNIKQEGYRRKMEWLKQRYSEGLKFKILHSPQDGVIGSIEYIPGEYTWRAVEAGGYMVIHCIFIIPREYKGKGYGSLLLKECIKDAREEKMYGVAVVTRRGTWMAGKELFVKNGFEVVDRAPPDFELLVKKLKKDTPSPRFKGNWQRKLAQYSKGLTIILSDQCPYIAKMEREIYETAEKTYGVKPKIVKLNNCKEAQNAPSAFAICGIVYDGKLVADHPISNTRFKNIMNKELKK